MSKKLLLIAALVLSSTLIYAGSVYAVDIGMGVPSDPSGGTCAGGGIGSLFCGSDLPTMLNDAFQIAISLGAVLAMLRIAYAGYLYMGSADMWSSKQHAKDVFRDAIVGLLLLLAVYLILWQINPDILSLKIQGITN